MHKIIITAIFVLLTANLYSQRVAFISSKMIREKFPEAQRAEQRIQSSVDGWKREMQMLQEQAAELEFEVKKNRLIWTDSERLEKEGKLRDLQDKRTKLATTKFEPGGEYDQVVKMIQGPIEEKIYAAVQKVSAQEGFDIVLDQSIQPLPYVNFKYDLTLKILKELGVDVEQMEKDQQAKIQKDPRNDVKESKTTTKRKARRGQTESREPEQKEIEPNPAENQPPPQQEEEKKEEEGN